MKDNIWFLQGEQLMDYIDAHPEICWNLLNLQIGTYLKYCIDEEFCTREQAIEWFNLAKELCYVNPYPDKELSNEKLIRIMCLLLRDRDEEFLKSSYIKMVKIIHKNKRLEGLHIRKVDLAKKKAEKKKYD